MSWPVEYEGAEYEPIPERWIEHDHAYDSDDRDSTRLYAISVHEWTGKNLKIRYASANGWVLVYCPTARTPSWADRPVPERLADGRGWPRTRCAPPREPHDKVRGPERRYLEELWAGRDTDRDRARLVPDGGRVARRMERTLESRERGAARCPACGKPVRRCDGGAECPRCRTVWGLTEVTA